MNEIRHINYAYKQVPISQRAKIRGKNFGKNFERERMCAYI